MLGYKRNTCALFVIMFCVHLYAQEGHKQPIDSFGAASLIDFQELYAFSSPGAHDPADKNEFDELTKAMEESGEFFDDIEIKQDHFLILWMKRIALEVLIKYLAIKKYLRTFLGKKAISECNEPSEA